MKRLFKANDGLLFGLALTNSFIGLVMVYDTCFVRSLHQSGAIVPSEFINQILFLILGLGLFRYVSSANIKWIERNSAIFWMITLVLLALVLKLGSSGGNAVRWLKLGPIRIQPSEIAKLAVVLYVSRIVSLRKPAPALRKRYRTFAQAADAWIAANGQRWAPLLLVMFGVFLTTIQPDLGTAAVIYVITFALYLVGKPKPSSVAFVVLASAALLLLAVTKESYRLERILSHGQRWTDAYFNGLGFQTTRSEMGSAHGGLLGVGLGHGSIKTILPARQTDFIFATIAEELGLYGAFIVIICQFALAMRLIVLSRKAQSRFGELVMLGTSVWITSHTMVNVMMTNGTLPPIGIPLPFISAGGSSLCSLWLAMGVCNLALVPLEQQEVRRESSLHRWWNRRAHLPRARSRASRA